MSYHNSGVRLISNHVGKVFNHETNRYVDANGKVGRKLRRQAEQVKHELMEGNNPHQGPQGTDGYHSNNWFDQEGGDTCGLGDNGDSIGATDLGHQALTQDRQTFLNSLRLKDLSSEDKKKVTKIVDYMGRSYQNLTQQQTADQCSEILSAMVEAYKNFIHITENNRTK